MKNEIINGGGVWRNNLNKYQEALYYQQQAKKPYQGISARHIEEYKKIVFKCKSKEELNNGLPRTIQPISKFTNLN